jgi:hypothetical protein
MRKIILIFIVFVAFGCSKGGVAEDSYALYDAADSGVAYQAAPSYRAMSNNLAREAGGGDFQGAQDPAESGALQNQERKLVKRASIRIRVDNLETADSSVSQLMEKYEAYAASTSIYENSNTYSIRVPAHFYDLFLSDANGLGRVQHRNETTEDVTLQYYDLEGRLATKRELLKTFQAYLGRANNIDEILKVEARISELQYDIDSTGKQLRSLANRVDYATIDLTLLGPVSSIPRKGLSLGERVKQLFNSFGGFLGTLVIIVIGIIIFGVPILLLLGLLFWLLFGRIGLIRRFWRLVAKKQA